MEYPVLAWGALFALVLVVVLFDVFVFGRNPHKVTLREAGIWSAIYISMGIAFTGVIAAMDSTSNAGDYLA